MTGAPTETMQQVASIGEGQQLLAHLGTTLEKLLAVIAQETAYVRAGQLQDATALGEGKNELARRYAAHSQNVKTLRMNQIVLATAHAVSEGIVRGVSGEMTRKTSPSTYGAGGRANAPSGRAGQPMAVSRTL